MKTTILTLAILGLSLGVALCQEITKESLAALRKEKKENALLIKKLKAEQQAQRDSLAFVKLNLTIQKQRETIEKLKK
jgi:hypothetical protein